MFFYLDFDLDFTTKGWLRIYSTTDEAKEDFFVSIDGESGCFLTNTDDFRVFVTKKKRGLCSNFTTENEQCIYVQNGTNSYEIYKHKFSFSQKDFKDSILKMEHTEPTPQPKD